MSDTQSPFMTPEEAAEFLRIKVKTLNYWRWSGTGPKFRKHGRTVVYHRDDLWDYSRVLKAHGNVQHGH